MRTRTLLLQKCMEEAEAIAQTQGTETKQSIVERTKDRSGTVKIKDAAMTRKLRDIAETLKSLLDLSTVAAVADFDTSFEEAMKAGAAGAWNDEGDAPI